MNYNRTVEGELHRLKQKHSKEMENYSNQIRQFVNESGNIDCDYLRHRRNMETYHRGAYNSLVELEKSI